MNITLGRFASWYARLGLILLGLAHGGQAQAWSATRLPEVTIPGGGPITGTMPAGDICGWPADCAKASLAPETAIP